MGHSKLGRLTRTKAWKEVVALIAAGADANQIAQATLHAAHEGFSFERICDDVGFQLATKMLVQIGMAAKSDDVVEALRASGIILSETPSVFEIKGQIYESLDNQCMRQGCKTDLGEIAINAMVGAMAKSIGPQVDSLLWAPGTAEFKSAFKDLGKTKGFGEFATHFFSNIFDRGLQKYLSHVTAGQLGNDQHFTTTTQKRLFDESVSQHCKETARVVKDFSSDWFSKHYYQESGNISDQSISGYANHAIEKMVDALKHTENYDG